ncbi:MAG: universal stress protein [Thermomicrobiales bacterium]|nr:universal stress protein [Thermomicrobiales bacterium]
MAAQFMFDRIVVPMDGSEPAQAALSYAARIPTRELILLHVMVDREVIVPEWILRRDSSRTEISMNDRLEKLAEELRGPDREVTVDVRIGDVAEEIIRAGETADMLVMMTHGRGAAGRVLFGSIADRVVRHGNTPTLLVRVGELTRNPKIPDRVVCALDGSENAERGIEAAVHLAKALDLPLHLIRSVGLQDVKARLRETRAERVAPSQMDPELYDKTLIAVRDEARAYLDSKEIEVKAAYERVTVELLEGSVPFTLMWAVDVDDILVITTRGQGGYKRWALGSVAEKLVREAPCPVFLERSADEPFAGL